MKNHREIIRLIAGILFLMFVLVVPQAEAAVLTRSITSGADDGYNSGTSFADRINRVYGLFGADNPCTYWYNSFFRFTNITIPAGSTISNAVLSYVVTTDTFPHWYWADDVIYAIAVDDYAAPTDYNAFVAQHSQHTSGVAWGFYQIDGDNYPGLGMSTPSIATPVQEVINRAGWVSGNDIGIHIDENMGCIDRAQGWASYENTSYTEPSLSITYTPPGITITQSGGSTAVTEGGATDTYTVVLDEAPSATVTVTVTGNSDVSVSSSTLTFTTGNWSSAQTVTVTAVNDSIDEDAENHNITHTAASSDTSYNGISIASVTAAVTDNDTASVTVTQSGGSTAVTEGGATDTYTVVLGTQPTANVTITVSPDAQTTTSSSTLTFTSGNWSSAQTVTVTAVDDVVVETDPHNGTITHTAASSDTKYNGISIASVTASVSENDFPVTEGYAESATFDTGATSGFAINSIYWEGSRPSDATVKFQVAVSSSTNFTGVAFEGSDGTSNTYYSASSLTGGEAIPVNSYYHSPFAANYRYLRYRVHLYKETTAPVVDKVIINWSK